MILRISGFQNFTFLEKIVVNIRKKIFKITCPTEDLKISLIENKIFAKNKVIKLSDPVINIKEFIKKER